MAKITTITNPLTGQPAQVDQLEHTAQQIDDAIARALPGGAIDTALANKAPAGFGYGESQSISSWDDEDGTKLEQSLELKFTPSNMRNKIFRTFLVDYPICEASGNGGFADIWADSDNDSNGHPKNITIVFYARNVSATGPTLLTKQRLDNTWYPWEYVNPPMILSKEYRTTERYLAKPVYVKVVNFGALPNGENKVVSGWTENARYIVSHSITLTNGSNVDNWGNIADVFITSNEIGIRTTGDQSAYSAYVTVYYTKTTD